MEAPEVRYTKSGEVSIAYSVLGDGPFDLILVVGFVISVSGSNSSGGMSPKALWGRTAFRGNDKPSSTGCGLNLLARELLDPESPAVKTRAPASWVDVMVRMVRLNQLDG
jgi:hypothetical protein